MGIGHFPHVLSHAFSSFCRLRAHAPSSIWRGVEGAGGGVRVIECVSACMRACVRASMRVMKALTHAACICAAIKGSFPLLHCTFP